MKRLTVLITLLLTACATPQEFRSRAPDATLQLRQPPERAALCMSRNIESSNIVADRRPTDHGYELIARVMGEFPTVYAVAEFTPEGTGSRALIWSVQSGLSSPAEMAQKMTKGC